MFVYVCNVKLCPLSPPLCGRWVLGLVTHPFLVLRHQCQLHILYPCPSAPFGSVGALYRAWASQVGGVGGCGWRVGGGWGVRPGVVVGVVGVEGIVRFSLHL